MKPLLFDVRSLLKNSFYIKEVKSRHLNDQFHFHNAYEIALVLKGNGRRIVGDKVDNFSDDDLIVLSPNLPHASYSDKKYHVQETTRVHALVIYFQPDWFAEPLLNSIELNPLKEFLNRVRRGIELHGHTRTAIRNYMMKLKSEIEGFKRLLILMQMLDELSRSSEYNYLASSSYSNKSNENDIKKINGVYKYVMENFTEKILLEDVAAIAHMTPSAFCKYFKSKTNKTFTYFVNEIRIGYACELLMNKELDISNVCFSCGFNNFTSFNKNFRDFTKHTPSEYRLKINSLQ